jgi:iron complex outermembrane receptor protein
MKTISTWFLGRCAIAVTLLWIGAGQASGAVLEEVVVTAQKREQNLSDVGISVTAFSGDQLRELGITSTQQLDAQVPGLMVTDYGGGTTTQFTIRGSAQLDFGDHQEPPVAVYSDGVYNSYLAGVGYSFFDLERIEVLRGPQGTLFGRNATGGLVHIISARPSQEASGYLELTGGEYDYVRVEAAATGPLSDSLSGRASVMYTQSNGYQENRIGDDLNDVDNMSGRLQLLFEPSDDFSALVSAKWSSDDTNGQGYAINSGLLDIGGIPGLPGDGLVRNGTPEQNDAFCAGFFGPPFPLVPGATDCFGYTEPDNDPHSVSVNEPGFFERDHYGISATIEWNIADSVKLVSISNWQDFEKEYLEDVDASPQPLFTFSQQMESNQVSQELRLQGDNGDINWVTGLYYLNIDSSYQAVTDVLNCCLVLFDNSYDLETDSYAVFGQLEYAINEQFSVIAGLRWTEDEKDISAVPTCTNAAPGSAVGLPADPCEFFFGGTAQIGPPLVDDQSEGEWSGLLEVDWRPDEDWLLYAKASRGNKAGGYNAGATFLFDAATVFDFDGEVLNSYEVGFKGALLDGKARLNASIFYYDYEDFQSFASQGANLVVFNTDAENTGGEIELILAPLEGLELLFGLSVQDAKQKDVTFAGATRDMPMPNAPDLTFNGLARYQWGIFDGIMSAQVDFNYVDERALNGIDHPGLVGDSYTVGNARVGFTTADDKWNLAVWVKNFTDEEYVPTIFDLSTFTGAIVEAPGRPRWWGATVSYRW